MQTLKKIIKEKQLNVLPVKMLKHIKGGEINDEIRQNPGVQ